MLRIHFTPEDIGRVRVAAEPDPMWETVFSVFRLRRPGPRLVYGRFREQALRQSRRADLDVLLPLVQGPYYPDFLTPFEAGAGLDTGVEAILSTPAARLTDEMTQLAGIGGPSPSWMRGLAEGDVPTLRRVAEAMRSQYETVVAPFWPEARAQVEAERAKRARALLDGGCEGLLDSYRPMMRWERPVLEMDVPFEQSVYLGGRGLTLVPSYLSWGSPDVLRNTDLPPVLVYPIDHDLTLRADPELAPDAALAALIGQTRAAVLESVDGGRTTSELARRVGVSAGSISQHTAILRDARLIHTTRVGKSVLHTLTPLGAALLDIPG